MVSARSWDRFARWPKLPARLFLAGIAVLLVLAALWRPDTLPAPSGQAPAAVPATLQAAGEWKDEEIDQVT